MVSLILYWPPIMDLKLFSEGKRVRRLDQRLREHRHQGLRDLAGALGLEGSGLIGFSFKVDVHPFSKVALAFCPQLSETAKPPVDVVIDEVEVVVDINFRV